MKIIHKEYSRRYIPGSKLEPGRIYGFCKPSLSDFRVRVVGPGCYQERNTAGLNIWYEIGKNWIESNTFMEYQSDENHT